MKTVAIIQARMGSSRLPGKVLLPIAGRPMLQWVTDRIALVNQLDDILVATSVALGDEAIVDYCRQHGLTVFRGSQFDVLDRYYQAAAEVQADVIVRVTADCPLIDPALIDRTIAKHAREGLDFAANRLPPPWKRSYPIGLDVEVCTMRGLARAWREAQQPFEREHVMPYFYDQPGRFKIGVLNTRPSFGHLRWTVDTREDLVLLEKLVTYLPASDSFGWKDVLAVVMARPELSAINAHVAAKQTHEVDQRGLVK